MLGKDWAVAGSSSKPAFILWVVITCMHPGFHTALPSRGSLSGFPIAQKPDKKTPHDFCLSPLPASPEVSHGPLA